MRTPSSRYAVLALVLLVGSAAIVHSQIRTRVDLVVAPVTVKDAQGKPVSGLAQEDFIVMEDGVPQTISSFEAETLPISAAIVVDDGMTTRALQRLTPQFGAPLFVALLSGFTADDEMIAFRYNRTVVQLSEFTNDHQAIEKS